MTQADVVIAGGGPTGLMLASEMLLAGVEPVVLDRLPEISQVPKGNGLIGQIVPMLDYRGLLDRFRAEAHTAAADHHASPLQTSAFDDPIGISQQQPSEDVLVVGGSAGEGAQPLSTATAAE